MSTAAFQQKQTNISWNCEVSKTAKHPFDKFKESPHMKYNKQEQLKHKCLYLKDLSLSMF